MKNVNLFRKMGWLMAFVWLSTSAMAEDFQYLTFETMDGAKASVEINSITMTIEGGKLVVGNQTFVLANLNKMYFSVSDETTVQTGISQLELPDTSEILAIYDLQGHLVNKEQLKKGVCIVKTKGGTRNGDGTRNGGGTHKEGGTYKIALN